MVMLEKSHTTHDSRKKSSRTGRKAKEATRHTMRQSKEEELAEARAASSASSSESERETRGEGERERDMCVTPRTALNRGCGVRGEQWRIRGSGAKGGWKGTVCDRCGECRRRNTHAEQLFLGRGFFAGFARENSLKMQGWEKPALWLLHYPAS